MIRDWRSNTILSQLTDIGFMLLAMGLAIFTDYLLLASIFGAKALVTLIFAASDYRRNRRLRFQLMEHLHQADVHAKIKR